MAWKHAFLTWLMPEYSEVNFMISQSFYKSQALWFEQPFLKELN